MICKDCLAPSAWSYSTLFMEITFLKSIES